MSNMHRSRWIFALVVAALAASSCQRVPTAVFTESTRSPLQQHYLTQNRGDSYDLKAGPAAVRFTAPNDNWGVNTRAIVWPAETPAAENAQSCATWTDAEGARAQQGIALRIEQTPGRFRAITVTKNVWFGVAWQFNVNTWDSDRRPLMQVHGAIQLTLPFDVNGVPAPLPWRVCARVVGDQVTVKGWTGDETQPTWQDRTHSGSVRLPEGWTYEGHAGWYAGHLPPGGTIGMSRLRTTTWSISSDRPRRSEELDPASRPS